MITESNYAFPEENFLEIQSLFHITFSKRLFGKSEHDFFIYIYEFCINTKVICMLIKAFP